MTSESLLLPRDASERAIFVQQNRRARKLSQFDLARQAKINPEVIARIERGVGSPRAKTQANIIRVFKRIPIAKT
jgi:transcriptional regulator with XRE-family HTH domain